MKMKTCLLVFGIAVIAFVDSCSHCFTKHPQQHYCDSYFAMQVKIIRDIDESDVINTRQYKAKILNSWRQGPQNGKFKFYVPDAFCGATLHVGRVYVITGTQEVTDGGKSYLLHGSCDFSSEWRALSPQQKMGFRQEYAQQCDVCSISNRKSPSDMRVDDLSNDFKGALTFWTPTGCYYNPHKTQQFMSRPGSEVKDCEEEYGLCARNREGVCQWKMNTDYKSCFKYRDNFVFVDSGDFAITEESQCDVYTNRRKRLKCRKTARKYQKLANANREYIRI